jgi:hypothetical protein
MADWDREAAPASALVERAISGARLSSEAVATAARHKGLPTVGDTPTAAVQSLRRLSPAALDPLAVSLTRPQSLAAAAQGFATGVGGLATLPLRVSTDAAFALWFAVRATSGAMGAFGFPPETAEGQALLRTGLLAATGAASGRADPLGLAARHVTVDPSGTRLLASSARLLVRRLATATGRGQLGRAAPVIGGAVAAGVNASAVHLLARRARRHYRGLLKEWQRAVDAGDLDALQAWPGAPTSGARGSLSRG